MSLFSRFLAVVVIAFSLSAVAATAASAQPSSDGGAVASKKKGKKAKLKVKVQTTGQNAILKKGVKVRVKGRPGAKVRIDTVAISFDTSSRLAKSKKLRLGKKGKRVVRLRLVPTARKAAETCSALKLVAKARSGKSKARNKRNMVRQKADCRLDPVDLSRGNNCEFIAQPKEGRCMLPFPSDFYTVPDENSATGKRIDFRAGGMPKNRVGKSIGPEPYSAADGFSQGQGIVLKVPGLDTPEALEANDFVGLDRLSRYSEADQKAVVIDASTGERWPIWVQIDSNASTPEDTALMISPSVNFDEKGRYIVALRNLVDADGAPLQAPNAFRYYRDSHPLGPNHGQRPAQAFRGHLQDPQESEAQALRALPGLGFHRIQQREQLPPRTPHA